MALATLLVLPALAAPMAVAQQNWTCQAHQGRAIFGCRSRWAAWFAFIQWVGVESWLECADPLPLPADQVKLPRRYDIRMCRGQRAACGQDCEAMPWHVCGKKNYKPEAMVGSGIR